MAESRLILCGLGPQPPASVTLEAVRRLRSAKSVFHSLPAPAAGALTGLLGEGAAPKRLDPAKAGAAVLKALQSGDVAWALPGDPSNFAAGVWSVRASALAAGSLCEMPGALTELDSWLAETGRLVGYDDLVISVPCSAPAGAAAASAPQNGDGWPKAAATWRERVAADENDAAAWIGLAEAQLRQGMLVDAWRHLMEAQLRAPSLPQLAALKRETLRALGKPEEPELPATLPAAMESAEALARQGLPMEGVDAYTRVLDKWPQAEVYVRRARALLGYRLFEMAKADLDRAVALEPKRGEAWRARGDVRLLLGDAAGAAGDRARAVELGAGPEPRREKELEELVACAATARPPAPSREREGEPRGEIVLAGIGVMPPWSLSVGAVAALKGCDVVFQNLPGAVNFELIARLCKDAPAVSFRHEHDVPRTLERIFSKVGPGRSVGFITFGHPMIFGPLAKELLARARRENVSVRIEPALSSYSVLAAGGAQALGASFPGWQALVAREEVLGQLERLDPARPVLLQFPDSRMQAWQTHFFSSLAKLYPADHACLVFGPGAADWGKPPRRLPLSGLAAMPESERRQSLVFVPQVDPSPQAQSGDSNGA